MNRLCLIWRAAVRFCLMSPPRSDDNKLRVSAPIFLLRTAVQCWRCHASQEVIALAAKWSKDAALPENEQPEQGEPLILDNIHEMPEEILRHILSVHPQFEKRTSRTAETAYYMNLCKCGANFGDFYLHNEPGGAFFPYDEQDAERITIEELPFTGAFEFDCSYGMGTGTIIFEHGQYRQTK